MGLRYFGIRVTDLERSLKFYTEQLGLEVVRTGGSKEAGRWVQLIDRKTQQRLELNWYPPGSAFAARSSPGEGLDHIAFSVKDAVAAYHRLIAHGGSPALPPSDANGVEGTYFAKDPDGIWIELIGWRIPEAGGARDGSSE